MEARMLSLFDDEDFLPQEKPKPVKPKKSLAKKEDTAPEAEAANDDPATSQDREAIERTPAITGQPAELMSPERNDSQSATEAEEAPVNADAAGPATQEAITPEPEQDAASPVEDDAPVTGEDDRIEEMELTLTEKPEPPGPVRPGLEDEELNKQILSEIMLSDYSAFIHKEYPFDLNTVEVVKKDKEIKVQEPVKAVIAPVKEEEAEEEIDEEPAAPLPEWNLDKRYYTIGEVSQLFKVNTSHIRFWTNEFKLRPRTTRKGDRLYSPEDIAQLRLIHHLVKEKKHTIKGAKEKLKAEKGAVGNKLDLKESLVSLKDMLIQIKEQL